MTVRFGRLLAGVVGILLPGRDLGSQEHVGAWGALDVSRTLLAFRPAEASAKPAVGVRVGTRWRVPFAPALRQRVRWGVELAYGATDLRGMDEQRDAFAFSHLDAGLLASFRGVPGFPRLYVFGRGGNRTAERIDAGSVWNYAGTGHALGAGIEVPLTPRGRGLDVGVQRLAGDFTSAERLRVKRTIDVGYRAWMLYAGWSGPLTIGLPWQ